MSSEWVSGNYKVLFDKLSFNNAAAIVDGHKVVNYGKSFDDEKGTYLWELGDFGDAHEAVQEATGQKNNNIKISSPIFEETLGGKALYGILSEDGKKCTLWSMASICQYIWITEEEVNEMRNNSDPVDSPPSHYKIQPENQGKLIWVSGPPGYGKSTTCKTLMEKKGFVYYEGDCFMYNTNPFIPPFDGEPIDASFNQKALKGISKERSQVTTLALSAYKELGLGDRNDFKNVEILNQFYTLMCEDIDKQRRRMGGDWAVGQAVPFKAHRDLIRSKLGNDLVFVVLEMDNELKMERLRNRKGLGENIIQYMVKIGEMFDPASQNEKNAIALNVTRDFSPVDVVEKILDDDLLQNNLLLHITQMTQMLGRF